MGRNNINNNKNNSNKNKNNDDGNSSMPQAAKCSRPGKPIYARTSIDLSKSKTQ